MHYERRPKCPQVFRPAVNVAGAPSRLEQDERYDSHSNHKSGIETSKNPTKAPLSPA